MTGKAPDRKGTRLSVSLKTHFSELATASESELLVSIGLAKYKAQELREF